MAPFNQNVSEYTKEQLESIVQTQIDDIRKAFKSNEQEVIISYGFAHKYKAPASTELIGIKSQLATKAIFCLYAAFFPGALNRFMYSFL